jgi:hypothetical protein
MKEQNRFRLGGKHEGKEVIKRGYHVEEYLFWEYLTNIDIVLSCVHKRG